MFPREMPCDGVQVERNILQHQVHIDNPCTLFLRVEVMFQFADVGMVQHREYLKFSVLVFVLQLDLLHCNNLSSRNDFRLKDSPKWWIRLIYNKKMKILKFKKNEITNSGILRILVVFIWLISGCWESCIKVGCVFSEDICNEFDEWKFVFDWDFWIVEELLWMFVPYDGSEGLSWVEELRLNSFRLIR